MGFAKAAAALLQGIAPRVQNTYSNAANADAGYARGLSDNVQGAVNQQAQGDNAFLTKMGTPSAGLVKPADVGGTAYGLQGYIPATTLQREGAAFGSAAQMFPGDALRQGQQAATSTLNDTTTIAKLQDELGKLAATQPEVYQKLLQTFQDNAFKRTELAQGQQRINISAQQGQERINIEAQRAAQSALSSNRNYRLSLARLGIAQKSLQLRALKSEAKLHGGSGGSGGFTPDELVHIRGQAGRIAQNTHDGGKLSDGSPDPRFPALNYKQAFKQEILAGIPPSIAIQALKEAGYKVPPQATKLQKTLAALAFGGGIQNSKQAQTLVALAHQYMGTPYVWGGKTPAGFDCSGFAQYIYGKVGISIPGDTYAQWAAPNGRPVKQSQLQPGDLVFFRGSDAKMVNGRLSPGHVGVYIGNGQMIDAPHTGSDVRIDSIQKFGGYMGARRYH
jgi:cell wall-associated NlpC family hydrolase